MSNAYTIIPAFIASAINDCIEAGVVPIIRSGEGGNSHSVWFIKFNIRVDAEGRMSKYHEFEVKITSSYQRFLEFTLFSGEGFDGMTQVRSMADCLTTARRNVELAAA